MGSYPSGIGLGACEARMGAFGQWEVNQRAILFASGEHANATFVRIIARSTIMAFGTKHPDAMSSLTRWVRIVEESRWQTTSEVQTSFPKAKVLNGERVRFEIGGGDYRLIASFKLKNEIVLVKFIGTRAEYDRIDALTVSLYRG